MDEHRNVINMLFTVCIYKFVAFGHLLNHMTTLLELRLALNASRLGQEDYHGRAE